MRRLRQHVGRKVLSLHRLRHEAAARGFVGGNLPHNMHGRFGFYIDDLGTVSEAFDVPTVARVRRDIFTGEECVLLLLRWLRRPGSLVCISHKRLGITSDLARIELRCPLHKRKVSLTQCLSLSMCGSFALSMDSRWDHLVDERSCENWAGRLRCSRRFYKRWCTDDEQPDQFHQRQALEDSKAAQLPEGAELRAHKITWYKNIRFDVPQR